MAVTLNIVASGSLSTTQTTLYKTLGTQSGNLKVTLVNKATTTQKANIWLQNGSSSARLITPRDLELSAQDAATTCYEDIGPGDSILGKGTSSIDYTINGILT